MKKYAIISLYDNNNYGNKLQNYAVQEYLKSKGGKVSTVRNAYATSRMEYIVKKPVRVFKKFVKKMKEPIFAKRNRNFILFDNQYISKEEVFVVSPRQAYKLTNKYDYFFIGSDQVWNPNFKMIKELRFALFANSRKIIPFSASFGISKLNKDVENYKQGLSRLERVSVREDVGKSIVSELTGKDNAIVTLDPTMLLTNAQWEKVTKKPEGLNIERYVLTYFLGELSTERNSIIDEFARQKGWRVIHLGNQDQEFYSSGPSEFLYLEKNAELICTDSFHACVFGILFNTPFLVYNREENIEQMNSRIDTLFNKFSLHDRWYKGEITDELLSMNFEECKKVLEKERIIVNEYIDNATK